MRYTILALLLLCNFIVTQVFSQQNDLSTNAVSLELGRTGLIINVSYERLFIDQKIGLRIDAGTSFGKYLSLTQTGIGAFVLIGTASLKGEAGVDLHYISVDESSDDQNPGLGLVYPDYSIKQLCPAILLGVRHYKKRSLFRLGFAGTLIDTKFIPGGYISLGRTF